MNFLTLLPRQDDVFKLVQVSKGDSERERTNAQIMRLSRAFDGYGRRSSTHAKHSAKRSCRRTTQSATALER